MSNPSGAIVACNDIFNPYCYNNDPMAYTFFGWMGVATALIFANVGAAYGIAKSGIGIGSMSVTRPNLAYKSLISAIMAGILGIYGLIVSVILVGKVSFTNQYGPYYGYKQFASGLCCGLSSLASGYSIGAVGEYAVRANAINEDFYVGMILILIFAEAIGLFGLIVAIILS